MSGIHRQVLVLNASYEAINIVEARRAVSLVMRGKADVIKASPYVIRTSMISVPIPSVVRLREYCRMPRQNRAVSRKGVLLRDSYTCQYCNRAYPAKVLTMDHVIPRSRSGDNSWSNLITCCFNCNNKKGDRTPQEAGMTLIRQPRQVTLHAKHRLMIGTSKEWDEFLFF
jgi:5-methylcytosine-specific restriction endonuclease McrA